MRILLVKTSSLGDVVHNLPVVTDIHLNIASAEIDWAVENAFLTIPRLHPGVREAIPVELRRWRRGLLARGTWAELRALRERLRAAAYDFVIDTQGLIKSAVLTRLARGMRIGLDWTSSREPLRLFYDRTFHVPWGQHAVERNRQLAAKALGYPLETPARYGIDAPALDTRAPWAGALSQRPYAVLLHATSASAKLWPEHQWVKLGAHLQHRGIVCVLPWGNEAERQRSERIATSLESASVPPRLTLAEAAGLLRHAQMVFGLDTGLTHLAAALGAPTIGIYVATDPAATGLYGSTARNVGGRDGPPSIAEVIRAERALLDVPTLPR